MPTVGIAGDWDFNKFVQSAADMRGGNFISAESLLLAAGPAALPTTEGGLAKNCYRIGLVEQAIISQSHQLQRIFEIGSRKAVIIPGREIGTLSLARVIYNGPSLLKMLYYKVAPGIAGHRAGANEKFYIDLADKLFKHPIGLYFLLHTQEDEAYGAFYLEECLIGTHQMSIGAGATVLAENCAIEFADLVPAAVLEEVSPT